MEQLPRENKESELRESVFWEVISRDLSENFTDALYDAGYLETDEEAKRFNDAMSALSPEDEKRLLSVPFELRERRLKIFLSQKIPIESVIERLVQEAKDSGYTLGYHLSPFDIPIEKGKNENVWKIKGTELDDRDEKPMAYYSLDFDNLYRKQHQKYLYVVRADRGKNSPHKYDPTNNWGRASELSVVDRFDFEKVDEEVKNRVKEKEKEAKKAG